MNAKQHLKVVLAKEGLTVASLVRKLSEREGKTIFHQSIAAKLARGSMRFDELNDILEFLGYEIIVQKKQN